MNYSIRPGLKKPKGMLPEGFRPGREKKLPPPPQLIWKAAAKGRVKTKRPNSAGSVARARQQGARSVTVLTDSGNALYAEGDLEGALECFRQVLELLGGKKSAQGKREAIAHYNIARTYAALGRTDEALEHYRTATGISPRFVQAHNNLGMLLNELGQYEEASGHFRKALAADSLFAASHYGLAVALQSMGDNFNAVFSYQKALALNPDFYPSWMNLGLICFNIGSVDVAINCYKEAIGLVPEDPEAYYHIGLAYMASNQIQEAIGAFGKALELAPGHEAAQDGLQEAMYLALEASPPSQ